MTGSVTVAHIDLLGSEMIYQRSHKLELLRLALLAPHVCLFVFLLYLSYSDVSKVILICRSKLQE